MKDVGHFADRRKVAIYARYSSDLQRQSSIDDQVRICTALAVRQGWDVVRIYADEATSGATLIRPQVQKLLEDSRSKIFDAVVTEALDRLSRDQEDIAGIYKRLRFRSVILMTCAEGEINELHVGLKGTMNALFLKDLAAKTHRGLEGVVRQGRSAGGLTFGYDAIRDGEIRGGRRVNEGQAEIVNRIFEGYAAGRSPIAMARHLNEEGVGGPGGRPWLDTTIRGHAERGTGVLRNELYIGQLIWNRLSYFKDPETGRRQSRMNPSSEWVRTEVEDLRIVPQKLWDQVATQLSDRRAKSPLVGRPKAALWHCRRPKNFTTGLIMCGLCGKAMAIVGKDYLACNYARRRATCTNRGLVRRSAIESAVLDGLKNGLMAPDATEAFVCAFNDEVSRQQTEGNSLRKGQERELAAARDRVKKLMETIISGLRTPSIVRAFEEAEARKEQIENALNAPNSPAIELPSNLATRYRSRVAYFSDALATSANRMEAVQVIRSLIERIVVRATSKNSEIELIGDIARIIAFARAAGGPDNKKAAQEGAALSATEIGSALVVAGAGFEPTTFRL